MPAVMQPDYWKAGHLGENWKLMLDTVASDWHADIRQKN